jgi:hypothetical protein
MSIIEEIAAERRRQVEAEGWSPEHDDRHRHGEIAAAASAYANPVGERQAPVYVAQGVRSASDDSFRLAGYRKVPAAWPWDGDWWKPGATRRNLIKAAALIVAEIERLDRAEMRKSA